MPVAHTALAEMHLLSVVEGFEALSGDGITDDLG